MTDLSSHAAIRAALAALPEPDDAARVAARKRDAQLTKPPGSLGRLEELAIWYAGWRGEARPRVAAPQILVFAGNHGIAAQGVSAFPTEVTAQMVANFEAGGAAINQLADLAGARLDVHALDLDRPTADFTQGPAMAEAEACAAFARGWGAVADGTDVLVVGEMGIGNTTSATALASAILGGNGWAGRGTGVDDAGLARKEAAVARALAVNADRTGLGVLTAFGGRELAAMAGAIAGARARRVPVILDGFICTAAALTLWAEEKGALDHCVAGHLSAEGAHGRMLDALGMAPLLSLGLRLGEGSGAALAIQVLRGALACHSGMATFSEAGVAGG
ncbi:Nicotinate-nucleotide--dimethylbenzimidazole phosphoribosyltransferase [Jannaschia seosinensis]|uniref:Nicotinate-nucleotide--dimethylbenzimidazole phosphoribosyltransferase n=1 Tax=Jannaschia seosinensis TaxID=313367 RepID=A0A0M7BD94_9RHOB|nr:nicotinate-nucleotide--dimethylbenzimidazole phosphoribosyltransferase [Jannaschia seosinensis]CUH39772.1 Nicotinate-nucleotide--dimethylbenzimidazole phosphoribosyltransferase [Jannaschia seosinensis]